MTRAELVPLRRLRRDAAYFDDAFEAQMLSTREDNGRCVFLLEDLRCGIHAEAGPDAKPFGCRRFPLGVTATPRGGRVTTDHRCPCRTLGDRPDLTPESVGPSVSDSSGRVVADRRVSSVRLRPRTKQVPFERWEQVEYDLMLELSRGEKPWKALGAAPFPRLDGERWSDVGASFIDEADESQFGVALKWFGSGLRAARSGKRPDVSPRPWRAGFDRAEGRPGKPRRFRTVFADWLADEIWSLKWTDTHDFETAKHDLATLLAVGRSIADELRRRSARPDRAAAEALLVIDLVSSSDYWADVCSSIVVTGA